MDVQLTCGFDVFADTRKHLCSWCDSRSEVGAKLTINGDYVNTQYACRFHRRTFNEYLAAWRAGR